MSNKLKIVVYAICKNEEKFVDRWVKSMQEADEIVVLDTGSTDNTVSKLKELGVKVEQKVFSPFRFDQARNCSLDLIPSDTDVCVCTDLDEVFENNWREKIEKVWIKGQTKMLNYTYVWNVLENGQDGITFYYQKIHAKDCARWIYPVHEVLEYSPPLKAYEITYNKDLVLRHFPDPSKSRSSYLSLLELSIKEHPESDRNTHYLAREYMFYGKYEQAIKTFKKHLKMKNATWKEEKSASCRYIGDCYTQLKKFALAQKYYKQAIALCPDIREPYFALAKFYYEKKKYIECIITIFAMLSITNRNYSYMTQSECWQELPYDYLSMCFYFIKDYQKAYMYCQKALEIAPNDKRIANNFKIFENLIKNN